MPALGRKDRDDEDEHPGPQPDDSPRPGKPGPPDRESPSMSVEIVYAPVTTPTDVTSRPDRDRPSPPLPGVPPRPTNGGVLPFPVAQPSSSPTWTISTTTLTPQPDSLPPLWVTNSPSVAATDGASPPTHLPGPFQGHRPGLKTGGLYAATAIMPIVVLAVVAAIVYFCMRNRKQRRSEEVATQNVEEMEKHPWSPVTTQEYMVPSGASPPYIVSNNHLLARPNPALLQPVILGPIPSGNNGAYFTGIDTSDAVSMNSARPPPNPFADNESLTEPPPPYRPRSVAPPSFSNSSRQSSFRATMAPPESSRTHLIERPPFEDPFDDDAVSDLSGPTAGQRVDAMSAVSDLSYQNEPVVNRSTF